jgi:hypothetical protein
MCELFYKGWEEYFTPLIGQEGRAAGLLAKDFLPG